MKKIIIIFILLAGSLFAQTASPAMKKAINDSLTAMHADSSIYTGILDVTNGEFKLPRETAARSDTESGNSLLYYNIADSLFYYNAKNNANDKFPLNIPNTLYMSSMISDTASALIHDSLSAFQLNGSYWTTNSSQSSLTGTKTITSGGISLHGGNLDFGVDYTSKLIIPVREDGGFVVSERGEIQLNRNTHNVEFYNGSSATILPDTAKVSNMIDDVLSANAVTHEVQISVDSVDFSNSNTINAYIDADAGGVTLYPKNYQAGIAQQIVVYAQGAPTISFGSITLLYESGVGITNHGTGYYRIWFTYLTATKCLVDWGFYE